MTIDLYLDIRDVTIIETDSKDKVVVTFWPEEEFSSDNNYGEMSFEVDKGKGVDYSRNVYNIEPNVTRG